MPIKSLFHRPPEFHRAGIIRLGVKEDTGRVKDGKPISRPREVDYFVLPPDLRERHLVLGLPEKPTQLTVTFPSNDPERFFPMHIDRYGGSSLKMRCDGEMRVEIADNGDEIRSPCEMDPETDKCPCKAKALGRLNVIVKSANHTNVYQVMIGGMTRCRNLMAEILGNQAILSTGGVAMSSVWFVLSREARDVQVKTDAGRVIQHGFPVHCVLPLSPDVIMRRMIGAGDAQAALEAVAGRAAVPELAAGPKTDTTRAGGGPGEAPAPESTSDTRNRATAPSGPQARDATGAPDAEAVTDDFSICLSRALPLLNVLEGTYRTYVCATMGVKSPDELDALQVRELLATLDMAERNPGARKTLRETIFKTAKDTKTPPPQTTGVKP